MPFSLADLRWTAAQAAEEIERITTLMRDIVRGELRKRGAVIGLSGGIDSSVAAALCVRAFGRERVLGLFMNEDESSPDTERFAQSIADHLQIKTVDEKLSPMLASVGCYARRDEAIRTLVPSYGPGWQCKLVLPSVVEHARLRLYHLVVRAPDGELATVRMPFEVYMQVVAATSFKQRMRKMLEYYHADRNGYAVVGTPNLLEYDQGFFVKNGDGAADIKPIAHLYKTRVYQLAEVLGIPDEIRRRPPTSDTYSLPQTQEELFFSLRYDHLDACLFARDRNVPPAEVAAAIGLTEPQIQRVFADIDSKRAAAHYLHTPPVVL